MRVKITMAALAIGAILTAACLVAPAVCQTQNGRETAPALPHLVGHEEADLLALIQSAIDDWDPRALVNPYLRPIPPRGPNEKTRYQIRRKDLLEFIADPDAAVALGKAFFWEMQAGSDFGPVGPNRFAGTACASCHFRFGQDSRNRHTARVPYVGWTHYPIDPAHPARPKAGPADPQKGQFLQLDQKNNQVVAYSSSGSNPGDWDGRPKWVPNPKEDPWNLSLVIGSQGVERRLFNGLVPGGKLILPDGEEIKWTAEKSKDPLPFQSGTKRDKRRYDWEMFRQGDVGQPGTRNLRQITGRNSPSVINATFADRLFHDGRAESTFNGFSIHGDHDRREVIHKRTTANPPKLIPVQVAIPRAALASQATGPIVNEVEMSFEGRTFPDVARKLLKARILAAQNVAPDDSVFRGMNIQNQTYKCLIRKAFRSEWWDDNGVQDKLVDLELKLARKLGANGAPGKWEPEKGSLMEANFPLYWGLSLMLYQSTLVSGNSPFDRMMRGDSSGVMEAWNRHKDRVGVVYLDRSNYSNTNNKPVPPVPGDELDEDSRLRENRLERGRNGDGPPGTLVPLQPTAIFQRGLRVFNRADCRDCHDGPNFSELYDRTANSNITEGIAKILSHTLLPNAAGDAAGSVLVRAREDLVDKLADLLAQEAQTVPREKLQQIGWELVSRLISLDGDLADVKNAVALILSGFSIPSNQAARARVSKKLFDALVSYEKTGRDILGRRPYITEADRISLAELITLGVLVEKMAIPPSRAGLRPPLPSGGLPYSPHAFYDAGFYTLGVTHPRFDRGIGGTRAMADLEEDEDSQDDKAQEAKATRKIRQAATGAAGSAYRLPVNRKQKGGKPNASEKKEELKPETETGQVSPLNMDFPSDTSWSRTERFPEINDPDPANYKRRSHVHFLSRARDLVVNEETWGHRKPFLHDHELMFWGGFKTPSLRNVELTGPYMHNGQLQSLEEVIEFYDKGGLIDQSREFNPDKHPRIRKQDMTRDDKKALLFFLLCLTDESVRSEKGPFDHPSLVVPNGYAPDWAQIWVPVQATGAPGSPPRSAFPSGN